SRSPSIGVQITPEVWRAKKTDGSRGGRPGGLVRAAPFLRGGAAGAHPPPAAAVGAHAALDGAEAGHWRPLPSTDVSSAPALVGLPARSVQGCTSRSTYLATTSTSSCTGPPG